MHFIQILFIIFIIYQSQACLESCKSYQYCEYYTVCKDCDIDYCASCKDASTCTQCVEGYYLQSLKCIECPSQCLTCTGMTECQKCAEGYYLSGGQCFNCPSGCATCSDTGSTCSSCKAGYYLNQTQCWNCMFNCASCTDPNTCNACQQDFTGTRCQCQAPQIWDSKSQSCTASKNWAVIIVGTSGFSNYRHQADGCHAYQTLINKGLSKDYIIMFSYNDAASSSDNPYQGKLFNKPCNNRSDCQKQRNLNIILGWDVNDGCKIDYSGATVTPANIYNVLKGDSSAMSSIGTGRVLKSNSTDNIFIYFVGDGGTGILGAPGGQYIYAKDLQTTLETLKSSNKFNQLVFYIEAAKSGSMTTNYTSSSNIYFLTAANATGTCYGTYCSPNDEVLGVNMNTCLGDMFSCNFLQDTDAGNIMEISLEKQYQEVKKQTTNSTVSQYGDLSFTGEVLGTFMGQNSAESSCSNIEEEQKYYDVRTIDVELLKSIWLRDPENLNKKIEYYEEVIKNDKATLFFSRVARDTDNLERMMNQENPYINNWQCYKESIEIFEQKCMKLTNFSKQYMMLFAYLCEEEKNAAPLFYLNEKIKQYC